MENNTFTQEDFDQYFMELLNNRTVKYFDKDHNEVSYPTAWIELLDENGEWLFEIRTEGKRHLLYSYDRIYPLFKEKFCVNHIELKALMKPMLNSIFNLKNVAPQQVWR